MSLIYREDLERIYVVDNNQEIAEMTFSRIGQDKAAINHTYVDPRYRGQGIANKLLSLVLKKLKQEQREIISLCSFVDKKLI
ncbi:hypothetical protein A9G34_08995 [Gilliamella sp. Choc4-2]|jgi:uncharacterized protein|uniref:GNAT family N-acetyltransferase n=1 Tax=unclassified Gilliamella TaxID=2685620 RepID=UPI000554DEFF|nr:GNAT family N-acetyltransferase [Gilliamella apicola]OCG31139.1 hypothetical protein A9G33_05645 [Gilliamella apicola]OCG43287.1 hypothetical protein A9G34_08995 [Gilliamella apicola]OCG55076.1 hypothetical protein A9G36_06220 [Gilliamella apicola]OCG63919.1 hypothetical protein A9G48_04455 [Gilliamella apicola]